MRNGQPDFDHLVAQTPLALVEAIDDQWERIPKGRVREVSLVRGKGRAITFALDLCGLKLIYFVYIGPRGGVKEQVFLLEPAGSVPFEIDRLVFGQGSFSVFGCMLDLPTLRSEMSQQRLNQDGRVAFLTAKLEQLVSEALANPAKFLANLRLQKEDDEPAIVLPARLPEWFTSLMQSG